MRSLRPVCLRGPSLLILAMPPASANSAMVTTSHVLRDPLDQGLQQPLEPHGEVRFADPVLRSSQAEVQTCISGPVDVL